MFSFYSLTVCCLACNMFSDSLTPSVVPILVIKKMLLASPEARLLNVDYISLLALTSKTQSADVITLANVTPPSSKPVVSPQPKLQGKWVTVKQRRRRNKLMPVTHSQPISISNRFSANTCHSHGCVGMR